MRGGREEFSNQITWMFFWEGNEYKVVTSKVGGGHQKLTDAPYIIAWEFVKIEPSPDRENGVDDFYNRLKEALERYGYAGARKQLSITIVKFNF